jgi:hypothetical protein
MPILFHDRIKDMKVLLPLALVVLVGCARSSMFHKDEEFFEDTQSGYYQSNGVLDAGGSTDRVEKLKQPRKKILVLGFWNDTPIGDETIGFFAAEEMKRNLLIGKKVIFPDEKATSAVTRDFVEGDRIQTAQLIREGKRVGVNTIVVGRISKIVFRQDREEVGLLRESQTMVGVDVEMKVFDASSGREVHSAKRSGTSSSTAHVLFDDDALASRAARSEIAKDAIADAVRKMTDEVTMAMEKMDWQGRVAKVVGNKIYINAGRASGLLAGDILKVMSPGEEIVDPITKSYLGRSEGMLKGTLEVSEFIGKDTSMTTIHTGGNFQEGDIVRLY